MAVKFQGGRMVPAFDNAGQTARTAAGRLSNFASGIDEVVRMLKRDGAGNPRLAAISSELDAIRQQVANVSKKLQTVK